MYRRPLLAAALLFAGMAGGGATAQAAAAQPFARPTLPVLTSLPLFWGEEALGAVFENIAVRSPLLAALDAAYLVEAIDTFEPSHFRDRERLLAIQPAYLPPDELVALDEWIRRGGRALIFSDPDLVWPTRFTAGDRRQPSVSSFLDPLFAHWGLRLDGQRKSPRLVKGRVANIPVTFVNPGNWKSKDDHCTLSDDRHVATCEIGKGLAILVADADLLDPRLWGQDAPDNRQALHALLARLENSAATESRQNGLTSGTDRNIN